MKKTMMVLVAMLISSFAFAEAITEQSLQGSWRVITLMGEPDEDEDYWEFNGNKFVQNLAGHRMSPDKFEIRDNVVDLGYGKIKVIEFGNGEMTANMAGFKYTLKKK